MTDQPEVLISQAWGYVKPLSGALAPEATCSIYGVYNAPVLIVHGLPESELRELIERRGVCEWQRTRRSISKVEYEEKNRPLNNDCDLWIGYSMPTSSRFKFCPSCGKRVSVGG